MNVKQETKPKIKNSSEETKKILQIEKGNISRVKISLIKKPPYGINILAQGNFRYF